MRLSGRIAGDVDAAAAARAVVWSAKRTAAFTPKRSRTKSHRRSISALDFPETFPAGAFGRTALPEAPAAVLIQGATVWTSGPQGTLQNADVLVSGGKIAGVGPGLKAPAGAVVIDGKGMHVTPGIVDCHSHTAISKGVNEGTHAVTCEVRIGDVVDATDIDIYRELAGGVTAANFFHGSANPIGGQNQVIKFRWGALPEEMKFADAMPGVKFALGRKRQAIELGRQLHHSLSANAHGRGATDARSFPRRAGIRRGAEKQGRPAAAARSATRSALGNRERQAAHPLPLLSAG